MTSESEQPTERQLAAEITKIITKAAKEDAIEQLTKKIVRKQLEEHFGVGLESQKKFINNEIQEAVNETVTEPSSSKTKSSKSPDGAKKRKRESSKGAKKASLSSDTLAEEDDAPEVHEIVDSDADDAEESEKADNDENGFSSLDEAAHSTKKRSKKPRSNSPTKKASANAGRKSGGEQPDAQKRLARLKALVVACGVRKPWKRLYEQEGITDENDFNSHCNVVQGVLRDLGMTGRGSMDQAKQIRDEREFRDEVAALHENVIDSSRGRRGAARASLREDNDDDDDVQDVNKGSKVADDDSEDEGPKKRFKNSLASFATDLNDSESDLD